MQAIIFDFGNVIGFFDHGRTIQRLSKFTDLSPEEMKAVVYDTPLEDAYEAGQIRSDDFLDEVVKRWRLKNEHRQVLVDGFEDIVWPNPELIALIPRLKQHCRLLLGSNTNELHFRQFRRQFAATLDLFDHCIVSFEIGVRKPTAGFFEHCLRRANCPPQKCLFIDDLAANVAGAKELGVHGLVYQDAGNLAARLQELGIQ